MTHVEEWCYRHLEDRRDGEALTTAFWEAIHTKRFFCEYLALGLQEFQHTRVQADRLRNISQWRKCRHGMGKRSRESHDQRGYAKAQAIGHLRGTVALQARFGQAPPPGFPRQLALPPAPRPRSRTPPGTHSQPQWSQADWDAWNADQRRADQERRDARFARATQPPQRDDSASSWQQSSWQDRFSWQGSHWRRW